MTEAAKTEIVGPVEILRIVKPLPPKPGSNPGSMFYRTVCGVLFNGQEYGDVLVSVASSGMAQQVKAGAKFENAKFSVAQTDKGASYRIWIPSPKRSGYGEGKPSGGGGYSNEDKIRITKLSCLHAAAISAELLGLKNREEILILAEDYAEWAFLEQEKFKGAFQKPSTASLKAAGATNDLKPIPPAVLALLDPLEQITKEALADLCGPFEDWGDVEIRIAKRHLETLKA